MDTFFLSHGSPAICIDERIRAQGFFKSWFPAAVAGTQAPRAILVVSAHWETDAPAVNVVRGTNDTVHDLQGLPEEMYKLTYPAPGAPGLAMRAKELLEGAGFGPVSEEHGRGLDHGAWVPLMLMFPQADVPVCPLSVQTGRDGTYHYNLGTALAPLRDEGVLVLGSGTASHSLNQLGPVDAPVPQWAYDLDTWLKNSLLDGRYDDVKRYKEKAPYGELAHPSPEHIYPLRTSRWAPRGMSPERS